MVVRVVTSKVNIKKEDKPVEVEVISEEPKKDHKEEKISRSREAEESRGLPRKKVCIFCKTQSDPHYFDINSIRRFLNDRGRISTRGRSGLCAKHQRMTAREIKRARHLALLSFTVKVTH